MHLNWSHLRAMMSLWKSEKTPRSLRLCFESVKMLISMKSLKNHSGSNFLPIWMQKVPNEALLIDLQAFISFFSKVSFLREWKAVKNSAKHTFVWSTLDVSFWLNHIFQANEYYMEAMRSGLGPGSEVPCMFTACGPPRLKTGKYNVPLGLYSEDTILESGGGNHGIVEYDFLTNWKDSYRIH